MAEGLATVVEHIYDSWLVQIDILPFPWLSLPLYSLLLFLRLMKVLDLQLLVAGLLLVKLSLFVFLHSF